MRIAFVNHPEAAQIPPVSSVAIWTHRVAQKLQAEGHQVVVYARGEAAGGEVVETSHEGILYRQLPVGKIRGLRTAHRVLGALSTSLPYHASQFNHIEYARAVALDVKRNGADIVHLHNYSQFAPVIRKIAPAPRIVVHMHCKWLHQLNKRVIARRLHCIDLVLGCSEFIVAAFRQRFPGYANTAVVANGVDLQRFHPVAPQADNAGKILFVGRISPEKGLHVALLAFLRIAQSYPAASLELVGGQVSCPYDYIVGLSDDELTRALKVYYPKPRASAESRRYYLQYLRSLIPRELQGRVRFTESVPYDAIVERYQGADIAILPATGREAFGMPVIEAMACGLPVVVTRSGGMPEIVEDGKTGLIVEREDVAGLAGALAELMENRQVREAMGNAGRQRALERYDWDSVTGQLLDAYKLLGSVSAA